MADGHVVINSEIDDDGVTRGLAKIKAKLKSLDLSLIKTAALGAAISLSPALVPTLAVATAATLALGASLAAAGIGAVAFGAVAVGALSKVFTAADEVAKLEEKIANADTAKERAAAQKELANYYASMSEAQRGALKELQNFKAFWGDFVKQFDSSVFNSFGLSLHIIQEVLNGLAPTINNVGGVIQELLESLDQDISNGGMKQFFDWLETNGAESLRNFALMAGNMLSGFFSLLQAFSPLGASMEDGLLSLTEKFKSWAASISENPAFQNFVDYVKENGPVLLGTIGNIVQVGKDLIVALAPLGTIVLDALEQLTGKISEFTPYLQTIVDKAIEFGMAIAEHWTPIRETIIGLAVAVGSFKAMMTGLQIIGVINTLISAYRAGTLKATLAQYGLNTAMLANPITRIVALIAALIAIGVLLYRNWDTVKAKLTELWSWMKEKWTAIKNVMGESMEGAKKKVVEIWGDIKNYFSKIDLKEIGKNIIQGLINGIKDKISAIKDAMKEAGEAITGKIKSILGIHSPSRVLMEIGEFTGEGLAIGLNNSLGKIAGMAEKMAVVATPNIAYPSQGSTQVKNGPTINLYPQKAIIDENEIMRTYQRTVMLYE